MIFQRILLTVVAVMAAAAASAAPKTDIVVFRNGDQLTGEVKRLERAKLYFDTDATGTIGIEWDDVAYFDSNQNLLVELEDGTRFLGPIARGAMPGELVVATNKAAQTLEMPRIAVITPIEGQLRDRLDGDIRVGFSLSRASATRQSNVGVGLTYRTETRYAGLNANGFITDSENNEASTRFDIDSKFYRLWPARWVTGGIARIEGNDQLGLDRRLSVGLGGGRQVRQTNSSFLSWEAGLFYSREEFDGTSGSRDSIELPATVRADWFRYDTPELDLSTTLRVIANLSDIDRVRADLDIALRWELIEDLFWELALYDRYDSDPPAEKSEKNDYGVVLSLGYDF